MRRSEMEVRPFGRVEISNAKNGIVFNGDTGKFVFNEQKDFVAFFKKYIEPKQQKK